MAVEDGEAAWEHVENDGGISLLVAFWVTLLSLLVATGNAFLFEREQFPLKNFLYVLMLTPLVIPGVILGISILVFSNTLANGLEELFGNVLAENTTMISMSRASA